MVFIDTICALATPPGTAGLAVVRLSGTDAFSIADRCFSGKRSLIDSRSHTIHYGTFSNGDALVDSVTASVFHSPKSYTGEHTVEFGCHGSMIVVGQILDGLCSCGARLAEPGEFTRRAFLNGKMDLTQVEAVADVIHSTSVIGSQTAARQLSGGFTRRLAQLREELLDVCGLLELELDFIEQDIEFADRRQLEQLLSNVRDTCTELASSYKSAELFRSGFFISLTGYPNAGKSSLFNALLQRRRAIVSDIAGTTRDVIEEQIFLGGVAVTLTDSAGLRDTLDLIEVEGIVLAESAIEQCNIALIVNDLSKGVDNSKPLLEELQKKFTATEFMVVHNKSDIASPEMINTLSSNEAIVSAITGQGIESLRLSIEKKIKENTTFHNDILINSRHATLLRQAVEHLNRALESMEIGFSNDILSVDVRAAVRILGEITGEITGEDILNSVFGRFCIGK